MKLDFAARVDIGPKQTNDDRVLVGGEILDRRSFAGSVETPTVMGVCDGVGGYAGGGIAAQSVWELFLAEDPETLADAEHLARVLHRCEEIVQDKKTAMPEYSAMCTTIAGCAFCDNAIAFFHSGDSRIYRHDSWGLAKMTKDHSIVQEMVDMGEITPEEALVHPRRNIISRCIGAGGPAPEIYISGKPVNPGEKYLFCSDGLWECVKDDEIKEVLDSDMPLAQMVDVLVEKALSNGSDDNTSVCICSVQGAVNKVEIKPFVLD